MNYKKLNKIIDKVTDHLLNLSDEEFNQKLEEHKNGDFKKILIETQALDVGEIEAKYFSDSNFLNYTHSFFSDDEISNFSEIIQEIDDFSEIITKQLVNFSNEITSSVKILSDDFENAVSNYIRSTHAYKDWAVAYGNEQEIKYSIVESTQKEESNYNFFSLTGEDDQLQAA